MTTDTTEKLTAFVQGMFIIRDNNTGLYAYHGEGWTFDGIDWAKRFLSLAEAEYAMVAIDALEPGKYLLEIVPV